MCSTDRTRIVLRFDVAAFRRVQNPEHLLIFAAGNDGGLKDIASYEGCTVSSPAIAKNVLAVGATSNSASRVPYTGADGRLRYEQIGITQYTPEGYPWICFNPFLGLPSTSEDGADIDTLAFFSSYGPASDGRIKPEVVAPGDQVSSRLIHHISFDGLVCVRGKSWIHRRDEVS